MILRSGDSAEAAASILADHDMPEICVAGYLPSAPTGSDRQDILLNSKDTPAACSGWRNTVFTHQPFCSLRIDQRHIHLVTVLPAEIFKCPVSNERAKHP